MQAKIFQSDTARKVLNAPKQSLRSAKQTLENCQENLQTLGDLLHKTVAQSQSVHIQSRIPTPEAEPVSPLIVSSHTIPCCDASTESLSSLGFDLQPRQILSARWPAFTPSFSSVCP